MKKYDIILSDSFEKELEEKFNYISFFLNEPAIAKKVYNKIINSISSLAFFPKRYSILFNIKKHHLHRLTIDNYVIIYKIDEPLRSSLCFTYI